MRCLNFKIGYDTRQPAGLAISKARNLLDTRYISTTITAGDRDADVGAVQPGHGPRDLWRLAVPDVIVARMSAATCGTTQFSQSRPRRVVQADHHPPSGRPCQRRDPYAAASRWSADGRDLP